MTGLVVMRGSLSGHDACPSGSALREDRQVGEALVSLLPFVVLIRFWVVLMRWTRGKNPTVEKLEEIRQELEDLRRELRDRRSLP